MAYLDALRRTFDYGGRSTRSQFWEFLGVMMLVTVLCTWVVEAWDLSLVPIRIVVFGHFASLTALLVRRFRDGGLSPVWAVLPYLPFLWQACMTLAIPSWDDDDSVMLVGGMVVVGCWILTVSLASVGGRVAVTTPPTTREALEPSVRP